MIEKTPQSPKKERFLDRKDIDPAVRAKTSEMLNQIKLAIDVTLPETNEKIKDELKVRIDAWDFSPEHYARILEQSRRLEGKDAIEVKRYETHYLIALELNSIIQEFIARMERSLPEKGVEDQEKIESTIINLKNLQNLVGNQEI